MCKSKQSNSRTFTKKAVKAFLKPLKFKSLRIPKNARMVAYVGFKTEKEMKQSLQKDKSFLGMYDIALSSEQSMLRDRFISHLDQCSYIFFLITTQFDIMYWRLPTLTFT